MSLEAPVFRNETTAIIRLSPAGNKVAKLAIFVAATPTAVEPVSTEVAPPGEEELRAGALTSAVLTALPTVPVV
jgi:hypothetical protein